VAVTTARSPLRQLKAQADKMAELLKKAWRGEPIDVQYAHKIAEARGREEIVFGVVMDDKVIQITMPWKLIEETSQAGLSEFILKQMRGNRDAEH
jgi:hypothetical protein